MKGKGTLMTDLDWKKLKIKLKHKYEMDLFAITDIIGTAVNIWIKSEDLINNKYCLISKFKKKLYFQQCKTGISQWLIINKIGIAGLWRIE